MCYKKKEKKKGTCKLQNHLNIHMWNLVSFDPQRGQKISHHPIYSGSSERLNTFGGQFCFLFQILVKVIDTCNDICDRIKLGLDLPMDRLTGRQSVGRLPRRVTSGGRLLSLSDWTLLVPINTVYKYWYNDGLYTISYTLVLSKNQTLQL